MMAPKTKSNVPETKRQMITDHVRSTRTCHTLKDLEKSLPPIVSINSIQVKEYIQNLVDDSKIRMEKIGSVNWYWSFPSDERRVRQSAKEKLAQESERLKKTIEQLESEIREKETSLKDENGDCDPSTIAERVAERDDLTNKVSTLSNDIEELDTKRHAIEISGAAGVKTRIEDIIMWKAVAAMWTDNIYIMEQYLSKISCGDRDLMEAVKKQCYGRDYVEGEGLCELQF